MLNGNTVSLQPLALKIYVLIESEQHPKEQDNVLLLPESGSGAPVPEAWAAK